ncbi:hypothetical protein D3C81_644930 [compost metagenome]
MQHGPGEIEHAANLAALLEGEAFAAAAKEDFRSQFGAADFAMTGGLAQVVEQLAQGIQHGVAAVAIDQWEASRVAKESIDGRQAWGVAG